MTSPPWFDLWLKTHSHKIALSPGGKETNYQTHALFLRYQLLGQLPFFDVFDTSSDELSDNPRDYYSALHDIISNPLSFTCFAILNYC
jgi:hypothetical protein